MAEMNCNACQELREQVPEFAINGFDDTMCDSLKNDTGLKPSLGHDDCTDLNTMNDCLVGAMAREVDSYQICDWKKFAKEFIPNLWTTLKAIICAICGIWTNIHSMWSKINCVYDGLVNLVDTLSATTQGKAFVRYYRDNSDIGDGYWWDASTGTSHTLNIYMDANLNDNGSRPADRDYVVIVNNCTDLHCGDRIGVYLTAYSSADTRDFDVIQKRQAQHPQFPIGGQAPGDGVGFSWTTSSAVLIKKGAHLKVNAEVYMGGSGMFRLHQFVLTWIPVNVDTELDPSEIIPC